MSARIAVVGAGPAGFYLADRLLRADAGVSVSVLDRLATPWGLVRAGVAPDHPKIKAVTRIYEKTAALAGFRFHGHVEAGTDISHRELVDHHHAVVYTQGASADRRLGIAGEDLPGSRAATEFVAWYNGHPDAADATFDLSGERAVVVGNGNVALDVARMLMLTREELARTDIADHALDALAASTIREVVVLGRRGPAQAAYTNPELRELGELSRADVVVDPAEVALDADTRGWLGSDGADATARRNVEIAEGYARRPAGGAGRRIVLRYLVSPTVIVGDDRVRGVDVVRNALRHDDDGGVRAVATGATERIACDLVLRSIGYRGTPVAGVPFDAQRGTIPHAGGRVLASPAGAPLPGVYTAGWIKRGPSGVIGTNKRCANETAAALLADLGDGRLPAPPCGLDAFERLVAERCPDRVDYAGWQRIDDHERTTGEAQARPRIKLVRRHGLLDRARSAAS